MKGDVFKGHRDDNFTFRRGSNVNGLEFTLPQGSRFGVLVLQSPQREIYNCTRKVGGEACDDVLCVLGEGEPPEAEERGQVVSDNIAERGHPQVDPSLVGGRQVFSAQRLVSPEHLQHTTHHVTND